jgi:Probable molybdopterin binding domain
MIADKIKQWCDGAGPMDLILTSGGTGFGARDYTPEAVRPLLFREAPGVAQALINEGTHVLLLCCCAVLCCAVLYCTVLCCAVYFLLSTPARIAWRALLCFRLLRSHESLDSVHLIVIISTDIVIISTDSSIVRCNNNTSPSLYYQST